MKLFKAEHDENGIWYFSTKAKLLKYINTSQTYLDHCMIVDKPCKGWTIEQIESEDIICKYIDPERKNI